MAGNGGKRCSDLSEDATVRHHLFDFLRIVLRQARIPASVSSCQVDRREETRLKGFSTLYQRETFSQAYQGNFSHYTAAKRLESDVKGINKTCKDTENMMF